MDTAWYAASEEDLFSAFQTEESGLVAEEVKRRLKEYGPNALPDKKAPGVVRIFLAQFLSPLIYILIGAAALVFYTGETVDAVIILLVLFFNAIVGTIQEGKAQKTLFALRQFVETSASVMREGEIMVVPDREVVPGDILILQEGDKVPADARVISSESLKLNESSLTGESVPVSKIADDLPRETISIPDQKNMVFKGTNVIGGHGRAVAVRTGVKTEIGKISEAVASIDTEVPLKRSIELLSRAIIAVVFVMSGGLVVFGVLRGESFETMLATAISLAVSVIPEGLPIVMTLVLATGVWRMTSQNVLVKKMQAVEALGQAKIIAVDKTGTLTRNEMMLQKVYVGGETFEVQGVGYEPKGDVLFHGSPVEPLNHPGLLLAARSAFFSANAHAMYLEEKKIWKVSGDPTEAALEVFARKVGFKDGERESPKIFELPFDYTTKYHATIHKLHTAHLLTVVGAPERVLGFCNRVAKEEGSIPLTSERKADLENVFSEMSKDGLRVLAFAYLADGPESVSGETMPHLIFGGFFGIKDPLREEAKQAIFEARQAGIRVVMMTGDHMVTARAIAHEAGLADDHDGIITGEELEKLSDRELLSRLGHTSVFARVAPDHKMRIIELFRKRGEVVAMTGDGVNDAPSLAAADLGVAMGKVGTEVAKEAADIVLLDDNFGNIIAAVEEGRNIYKTIKKVILYLFSTSIGEVFAIVGAMLLGFPLPVLPTQIIWLNFVTDGFLTVALAMEPKEKGLLDGAFKKPSKYIVDFGMTLRMIFMGAIIAVGSIYIFSFYFPTDMPKALTMSLTTLAIFQWFNAWNAKSESKSVFSSGLLENRALVGATALVFVLQIFAIYHPLMQKYLHTVPLSLNEWGVAIAVAFSVLVLEEIRKTLSRMHERALATI
ncbi:MAG: HAD-IC family P-type ATPase [Patescibacteria group bacterium]